MSGTRAPFLAVGFAIFLSFPSGLYGAAKILNVRDYGAIGDGVTDDRPAIQNALNAANQLGAASVYFGSGTYLLGSATSPNGQLAVSDWSKVYSIDLIGNHATLRTKQPGTLLFVEGFWQNSSVSGLTFENLHDVTMSTSAAIVFSGGGQNGVKNWTISGNTFRNFSRHIAVSGVTGLSISNNQFEMSAGRDSGTGLNPEPNVGIWLFNNAPNGTSANVQIAGNEYNGCESGNVTSSVSRRCGDGFVYGQGSAVAVSNNQVRGFSFEGIYLFRGASTDIPPAIQENTVDGTIVPGDISGGGQWGIRCDADGASIGQNTVINALNGITIYGADLPTDVQNSIISRNNILSTPGNTQAIVTGISITGASHIQIAGNTVQFLSENANSGEVSLIFLNGLANRFSSGLNVTNNKLISALPTSAVSSGVFLQFTSGFTVSGNTIQAATMAFHLMNLSGPASTINSLTGQNRLQYDTHNVTITNGAFN